MVDQETVITTSPEAQPHGVELLPCPLAHEVVNGLNISSSSGMRKWHLICFDCGLVFEGRLDETARELFARWNARADLPRATADNDTDTLHLAICQAVHVMNQGDLHAGHDLLRQTLVDYADKKAPLSRSEIVRQQQRGGEREVTAMMVSPASKKDGSNEQ